MSEMRKATLVLSLAVAQLILTGFGSSNSAGTGSQQTREAITRHIALLRGGKAQQKAAAAYWLGQQQLCPGAADLSVVRGCPEPSAKRPCGGRAW